MGKILVVVESPGKIKKIQSILGNKYEVVSSVGHIIDLDPNKSVNEVIDINNGFTPSYVPTRLSQRKVIKNLKTKAQYSSKILLAADEDREGEMIAWSIAHVLNIKNPLRIVFNSITKTEILKAVKSPKDIDQRLVDAQKTRRIMDRIVGYEISPLLWRNIGKGKLSAGRVQSVVVELIIDKENEIKDFMDKDNKSYFRFKGVFIHKKKPFSTTLHDLNSIDKKGIYKGGMAKIVSKKKSMDFLKQCIKSKFTVANVFDKPSIRNPSPPFTTSSLQQEAHRKLGFTPKKTMSVAQKLYEGGFITYMRTDSVNLSTEALNNIKKYIVSKYGNNYYRKKVYASKGKHTQEAHEACRPTDVNIDSVAGKGEKMGSPEIRLYSLIWKRTVASQMAPAEFNITTIQISISENSHYYFTSAIENLVFDGFLKVYNINNIEEDEGGEEDGGEDNKNIPVPKPGTIVKAESITGTEEYPKPPSRYNHGSIISKLENLGIGRPATYASFITKIQERGYARIGDIEGVEKDSLVLKWKGTSDGAIDKTSKKVVIGKEKNKFIPTDLGVIVNNFLLAGFPKIMDYKFTAKMENQLDRIANGKLIWNKILEDFYKDFRPQVEKLMKEKPVIEDKFTRILGDNPKSGDEIVATIAKYGPVVKLCCTKGKEKYAPIKKPLTLETITLDDALKLFEFPKELGKYKRKNILLNRGKYGFYIIWGTYKYSIDDENIDLDGAIEAIESKNKKSLAEFSSSTKNYVVMDGPYGKYINTSPKKGNGKKINVSLPKTIKVEDLTLEKVQEIVDKHFQKPKSAKKPQIKIDKKVIKKAKKKNINIVD